MFWLQHVSWCSFYCVSVKNMTVLECFFVAPKLYGKSCSGKKRHECRKLKRFGSFFSVIWIYVNIPDTVIKSLLMLEAFIGDKNWFFGSFMEFRCLRYAGRDILIKVEPEKNPPCLPAIYDDGTLHLKGPIQFCGWSYKMGCEYSKICFLKNKPRSI